MAHHSTYTHKYSFQARTFYKNQKMSAQAIMKTSIKAILLSNNDITTVTNVNIMGNTGIGDGYIGDIVFASATITTTPNPRPHRLDLVLKCSKPDPETGAFSTRIIFDQEIRMYDTILPALLAFQATKSPPQPFDNTAKFYGKAATATQDFLALENLKRSGYEMTDRTQALDTPHMEAVLKAYGEFHALSAAVGDQEPGLLDELECTKHEEVCGVISDFFQVNAMVLNGLQATLDQLKGILEEAILDKWQKLQDQVAYVNFEMRSKEGSMKVFTHGDCWSNNFMFKYDKNKKLEKVKILDWQFMGYSSPIMDLSYVLFLCAENFDDLERLLDVYYTAFSEALRAMGSDPGKVYPKEEFLGDWHKYARYGIAMCPVGAKMQLCQQNEAPTLFDGESEIGEKFAFQLKDNSKYTTRMKNVIQYAAKNGLID